MNQTTKAPERIELPPKTNNWFCTGQSLSEGNRSCTCCNKKLSGHAVVMLELDQRIDEYHDYLGVPENESQGWFPFGLTCAKRCRKNAWKKIQERSIHVGK